MTIYASTFSLATDAVATAVQPLCDSIAIGADCKLRVKRARIERTAGTGTQFKIRFFQGTTAAKTDKCVGSLTIPATADDFDITGQANSTPRNPLAFSTLYKDYPDGWTSSSAAAAGCGLWWDCAQVAGSSATNAVLVEVDIGR